MEALFISFIGGNLIANIFPTLLSVNECFVTIGLVLILIALKQYALATGLLGFVSVSLAMTAYTPWQPSYTDVGKDISIIGRVSTLVKLEKAQIRFNFKLDCLKSTELNSDKATLMASSDCSSVSSSDYTGLALPALVRLSWYQPEFSVKQGDLLKLTVRLKPPYGLHNEAGFDYQKWLISEGIVATGYIKQAERLKSNMALRQKLYDYYQLNLAQYEFHDLLIGLILGERNLMSDQRWQVLKQTGTAHLLAVSGLHLGLVFAFSWLIFKLALRPFSTLFKLNLESANLLGALIVTWLFCSLTGFALAATRAAIFLTAFSLFNIFSLHVAIRFRFVFATSLVLLLFPLSALSVSFWLSFSAAASIMFLIWCFKWHLRFKSFSSVKQFMVLQLLLTFLLIPVQLIYFQHLPVLSLFANLLAIPIISLWVLPVTLLAALFNLGPQWTIQLSFLLFDVANTGLEVLWTWLLFLAEFDFAYLAFSNFWLVILAFSLLSCGFLVYLYQIKRFMLALLFTLVAICIVISPQLNQNKSDWQVDILDVGQGLAIIITRHQESVLYDTGDAYQTGFNLFEAAVEPVLTARSSQLKGVVISHSDKDHSGGIQYIKDHYPDLTIWQTQTGCQLFADKDYLGLNWRHLPTSDGFNKKLNKAEADSNNLANRFNKNNNASCVFRVDDGAFSVLLTGDIEVEAESYLLEHYAEQIRSDVLIVPHHGSATSSSQLFIEKVSPRLAVNSSGLFNRFSHPHPDVIARYKHLDIPFINTASEGQIKLLFTDNEFELMTHSRSFYLPWHSKIIKDDLSWLSD